MIGNESVFNNECNLGLNQVIYQVAFDNLGGNTAGPVVFHVAPFDRAPGCYVKYYAARMDLDDPLLDLDAPAMKASYAELGEFTESMGPPVDFQGREQDYVVQIKFTVTQEGAGTALAVGGGAERLVKVDGLPYTVGGLLAEGSSVDARFLVVNSECPLRVTQATTGAAFGLMDCYHD